MSAKRILIQNNCGHCRHVTDQHFAVEYWFHRWDSEAYYRCSYFLFVCQSCKQPLLYYLETPVGHPDAEDPEYGLSDGFDEDNQRFFVHGNYKCADVQQVWPKQGHVLSDAVPPQVKEAYERALTVKAEPNSFAVQIRRALEAICVDRGEGGNNLKQDLGKLATAGVFPPIVAEIAQELKNIGNTGAHVKPRTVEPEQAEAIDDFFHDVVRYVYDAPANLRAYRGLLDFELPDFSSVLEELDENPDP